MSMSETVESPANPLSSRPSCSEDLRCRLRWWLAGYARAMYEARNLRWRAKAGIRGMAAVMRSQSLFPPNAELSDRCDNPKA